jgi:NADH:ubiquinone oxidoreductase subunit C
MKKIETSLENLKKDIGAFYKEDQHHYMVMNGIDMGEKMEVQWFFCDYAHPCDTTMFYTFIDPSATIPSINDIVKSAWVTEAEFVDLLGVDVENAKKGFVLEFDSKEAPLRKKK